MIFLGLTAADGFYSQTQNAIHHYRTGYNNRNAFSSILEKIRSEEQKIAQERKKYEIQQRLNKIYDRMSFLRQSCRCRFICTGPREACEELMFLEDQLRQ